jgi:hypothetical protein
MTPPSNVTSGNTTTTIVSNSRTSNQHHNQSDNIVETTVTNQVSSSKSSPTLFEVQKTTQVTKWPTVQPVSAFPLPKTTITTTNKAPGTFVLGSLPKETSVISVPKGTTPKTNETNFIVSPKAKISSVVQSDNTNDRASSWKFSQDVHKIEPKK